MFRIRYLVLLTFVTLLAAACGNGSSADSPSTNAVPAPVPALTTVPLTTPADFPVEVMSDVGPVTIEVRPERVVSLSATHTEIIYELGVDGQLVATDLLSNYPPAAEETTKLDSFNFNVEEVAALDPDLVIVSFDFQGETAALAAVDIPFLLLGPPSNLAGMYEQFRVVADALGVSEAGNTLATNAEAGAQKIIDEARGTPGFSFFHEVDDTYYTATSESFIGDIYSSLGLSNIADSASVEGPYPQLSAEFILKQDPDLIFLGDAAFGASAETVAARPGWDVLSAVTRGQIVEIDADISGRWGPRTIDLMRSILDAVLAFEQ